MPRKPKPPAKDPAAVSLGRRGGIARGVGLRAGRIAVSGAAVPKPTDCPRCGEEQPSARQAWRHCRKKRAGGKTERICTCAATCGIAGLPCLCEACHPSAETPERA